MPRVSIKLQLLVIPNHGHNPCLLSVHLLAHHWLLRSLHVCHSYALHIGWYSGFGTLAQPSEPQGCPNPSMIGERRLTVFILSSSNILPFPGCDTSLNQVTLPSDYLRCNDVRNRRSSARECPQLLQCHCSCLVFMRIMCTTWQVWADRLYGYSSPICERL